MWNDEMIPSAPRLSVALLVVAISSALAPLRGQPAVTPVGAKPVRSFSVGLVRQLRPNVEALPAIVSPHTPAVEHANAVLASMNRQLLDSLRECDIEYRRTHPSKKTAKRLIPSDWERRIRVTMKGPRLVAMVVDDLQFCGLSYPNRDRIALVFDMDNGGKAVDWTGLLTESSDAVPAADESLDGSPTSSLVMPALTELAVAKANSECKRVLNPNGDLTFLVWPDAKRGKLVVQATGLPHVVQACEEEIGLTADQARKAGFSQQVLDLLEEAHRTTVPRHGTQTGPRPGGRQTAPKPLL